VLDIRSKSPEAIELVRRITRSVITHPLIVRAHHEVILSLTQLASSSTSAHDAPDGARRSSNEPGRQSRPTCGGVHERRGVKQSPAGCPVFRPSSIDHLEEARHLRSLVVVADVSQQLFVRRKGAVRGAARLERRSAKRLRRSAIVRPRSSAYGGLMPAAARGDPRLARYRSSRRSRALAPAGCVRPLLVVSHRRAELLLGSTSVMPALRTVSISLFTPRSRSFTIFPSLAERAGNRPDACPAAERQDSGAWSAP